MSSRGVLLSCTLLSFAFLMPSVTAAQTMEGVDSRHVFDNANMVIFVQLERLEQYLDDETKKDFVESHAWAKEMLNLPTDKCQEIIIQFAADQYPDGPGRKALNTTLGIAFRCNDDISSVEIDAFKGKFGLDEFDHNGTPYLNFQSRQPNFLFSGNSLLLSETELTQAMIDTEKKSEDRDVKLLGGISRETDLSIQVDFSNESFREFFPIIFYELPTFHDEEFLKTIAQNASTLSLNVALESMHPFTLEVQVSESGDIEKLKSAVEDLVFAGQNFSQVMQRELTRGAPSKGITDTSIEFSKAFGKWLSDPEIDSDLESVTVRIADSEIGKETWDDFLKLINAVRSHFGG